MKAIFLNLLFLFILTFTTCNKDYSKSVDGEIITISGDVNGLPDGPIVLIAPSNQNHIIASTKVKNGRFNFVFKCPKALKYKQVTFHHSGGDTVLEFHFLTNKKYRGTPHFYDNFFLENGIRIVGQLKEFKLNFKLQKKLKLVYTDSLLHVGKQTWAYYNITPTFPKSVNDEAGLLEIENLIRKYPYSYYLLQEIKDNVTTIKPNQLSGLLSLFNEEAKETDLWAGLKRIADSNSLNALTDNIQLKTRNNKVAPIINPNERSINVLIFWASWCMPCKQEIPSLKKMYQMFSENKNVNIVSISLDQNTDSWRKAVDKEKMPWPQLILSDEKVRIGIFYKYKMNGAIPTIIIANNKGEMIKKFTGYSPDENIADSIATIINSDLIIPGLR